MKPVSKPPTNLPPKHPGIELEETKKRLANTPETLPMLRKMLQLKVQNLENEIRAKHGAEDQVRNRTDAVPQLQHSGNVGGIPKPSVLGLPNKISAEESSKRTSGAESAQSVPPAVARLTAHFGVVPVTDATKRGLDRIHEGFARAKKQLMDTNKSELAKEIAGFEAKYTKAFIERANLPQAIEVAKRALGAGYQVIVATESREHLVHRTRRGTYITYEELCSELNSQFSTVVPLLSDVYLALRVAFGDEVEDYSGRSDPIPEGRRVRELFLAGERSMLYTTYAIGGGELSLGDADYRDRGIFGGDHPRVSIFLGSPLSGALLKRAVGLTWKPRIKSDVHAVFLSTDSEMDVKLMQQRAAPLLRLLGAFILGEKDSLASVTKLYTDEQRARVLQDALAYAQGDGIRFDAASFQVRSKTTIVGINDWSTITFPPAEGAKGKQIISGSELTNLALNTHYLEEFGLHDSVFPSGDSKHEVVDTIGNFGTASERLSEVASVQNLDSVKGGTTLSEASSLTSQDGFENLRESVRNADQKAMYFLAALIAMLGFLITHSAPTGWFKEVGRWSLPDFLALLSILGLAVAVSMMLVVLYPSFRGDGSIKSIADLSELCALKYRTLRRGFWVGTVAAFTSLLFLILSKRPHPFYIQRHY